MTNDSLRVPSPRKRRSPGRRNLFKRADGLVGGNCLLVPMARAGSSASCAGPNDAARAASTQGVRTVVRFFSARHAVLTAVFPIAGRGVNTLANFVTVAPSVTRRGGSGIRGWRWPAVFSAHRLVGDSGSRNAGAATDVEGS